MPSYGENGRKSLSRVNMATTKILIVEDEQPIREMIAFHLSRAGFETLEACDSREARQQLADKRPGLALIDWMLPGSSGLESTRILKRDKNYEDLAIIMLTARADERDRISGLEGGADDCVTKPFSPRELVARPQAVLRRGGSRSEGPIQAGSLARTDRRSREEPLRIRHQYGEMQRCAPYFGVRRQLTHSIDTR